MKRYWSIAAADVTETARTLASEGDGEETPEHITAKRIGRVLADAAFYPHTPTTQ